MDKSMKIPMNLQLFAESGGDPAGGDPGSGAAGNQQNTNNQQAGQPFQFDYEKLANIVAGKQSATEESVLKGYFKQQNLTREQVDQAIAAYKEQQAANTPDVGALQQQAAQAQAAAQQANIEKEAMFLAGELGVDLKTMPYVLKLADLSKVADEKGTINKENLKAALNTVLEELPQLKPNTQTPQSGFRQIGSGGGQGASTTEDQLAAIFGNKK